jgi:hypothetical protein
MLQGYIQSEVARVLGLEPSRLLNPREGLFQMGMDSLMAVELKNRLETGVEQTLPATLTFDYPTIETLTGYLATDVLKLGRADASPPTAANGGSDARDAHPALEEFAAQDVQALLDQELAAIDQWIGDASDD